MKPHRQAVHKLDDLDAGLELAIDELRGYCSRLPHGRVILTVERYDRHTVCHDLAIERTTIEDLDRLIREVPRREKVKR